MTKNFTINSFEVEARKDVIGGTTFLSSSLKSPNGHFYMLSEEDLFKNNFVELLVSTTSEDYLKTSPTKIVGQKLFSDDATKYNGKYMTEFKALVDALKKL